MNTTTVKKILDMKDHICKMDKNVLDRKFVLPNKYKFSNLTPRLTEKKTVLANCEDMIKMCGILEAISMVLSFSNIVPVVHAAKQETPKKPERMKYQELPVYVQPHADYKEYENSQIRCEALKERWLYTAMFPHVRVARRQIQHQMEEYMKALDLVMTEMMEFRDEFFENFLCCARDPDNLALRKTFVALLTFAGFHFGNRKNHISKKLFFGTLGALFSGAICFPEETDCCFRECSYVTLLALMKVVSLWCGSAFSLRQQLPCPADIPAVKKGSTPSGNKCKNLRNYGGGL